MKNKFTWFALAVMIVLLGTILSGCNIGMDTFDEIIEKNDIVAQISYFSNGGYFNKDHAVHDRDLFYQENDIPLEYTQKTPTTIHHDTMVYAGWYTIVTKQIGGVDHFVCDVEESEASDYKIGENVVVFKHGDDYVIKIADYETLVAKAKEPLLTLDEKFDFENTRMKKGDKFYVATMWLPNQTVDYVLITEGCTSITVKNSDGSTTTYNDGSIVASHLFDANNQFHVSNDYNLAPVNAIDATFVDYYVYEDGANVSNLTRLADTTQVIERPKEGNVKVYVKYTYGDWEVVRFANQVSKMFTLPNEDYYISRDIDCEGASFRPVTGTFRGTIRGNGYTIKNFKVQNQNNSGVETTLQSSAKVALFGTLNENAKIENITFDNVTLKCTARPNASIKVYLFAHTLTGDALATINNVTMRNVIVDITLGENASVENIPNQGAGYDTTAWLMSSKTNVEVETAYTTLALDGVKLNINGDTASEIA